MSHSYYLPLLTQTSGQEPLPPRPGVSSLVATVSVALLVPPAVADRPLLDEALETTLLARRNVVTAIAIMIATAAEIATDRAAPILGQCLSIDKYSTSCAY